MPSQHGLVLALSKIMFGGATGGQTALWNLFPTGLKQRELSLDVIPPVANRLGVLWLEDQVAFMSVRVAFS